MSRSLSGLNIRGSRRASVSPSLSTWHRDDSGGSSSFFFTWNGEPKPQPRASRVAAAALARNDAFEPSRDHSSLSSDRRTGHKPTQTIDSMLRSVKRQADGADGEDLDDSLLGVSRTALFDRTRRMSDPARFVDTDSQAFVTLSTQGTFRASGVRLGDFATVMNLETGCYLHGIVGDSREVPGAEPSMFVARSLGLEAGVETLYLVHPRSGFGQGSIPDHKQIQFRGEALFRRPAPHGDACWAEIVTDFRADRA